MRRLPFLLLALAPLALAQPQPRLDLPFHTGSITAIAADAAQRFLVTIADDDTARVFDLPALRKGELRQLQLLRLPIGPLDDSRLYAVAITPDGATIAAAGPHSASIYLFDRATGRLLRRIAALPKVALQLAYSPDGRYLAAALSDSGGLRLYRTSDYSLASSDPAYKGNNYCVAFSPTFAKDGLLATGAEDLYVRLYQAAPTGRLQLLHRRIGADTDKDAPIALAFSPDARQLAVSFDYFGYPEVELWRPRTLVKLTDAIRRNSMGGTAESLAWSRDGKQLYLAGNLAAAGPPSLIVRIDQSSKVLDFDTVRACGEETECAIAAVLPLPDGAVLFAATNQSGLGIVSPGWKADTFLPAPIPFYAGLEDLGRFLLSGDGTALRFAYDQDGADPAWFNVTTRTLTPGGSAPGLTGTPPVDDFPHLRGIGTDQVLLNEKPLPLDDETSLRLAVLPDAQHFVIATTWSLFLFDAAGKQQWKLTLPAGPEAINVSRDARFVVAALIDGTIRWFSLADAAERLAFFPHPDQRRWLLWTPIGDYDSSPGADTLLTLSTPQGDSAPPTISPAHHNPKAIATALK